MRNRQAGLLATLISFAIFLAAALPALTACGDDGSGLCALVSVGGEDIAVIDLEDGKDRTVLLSDYGADIVLHISDGAVCFESSDCPDKICINSGWLKKDMDIAICMPNRTSVVVMPKSSADKTLPTW